MKLPRALPCTRALRPRLGFCGPSTLLCNPLSTLSSRFSLRTTLHIDRNPCTRTAYALHAQVWHLSHVARRFQSDEAELRRLLYEQTGGMFPELVTRPDLKLFLPPINGSPP